MGSVLPFSGKVRGVGAYDKSSRYLWCWISRCASALSAKLDDFVFDIDIDIDAAFFCVVDTTGVLSESNRLVLFSVSVAAALSPATVCLSKSLTAALRGSCLFGASADEGTTPGRAPDAGSPGCECVPEDIGTAELVGCCAEACSKESMGAVLDGLNSIQKCNASTFC